jgi:hypothetical protein
VAFVVFAEGTVSTGIFATTFRLTANVLVTVQATFNVETVAAVLVAGQVLLAAVVPDLGIDAVLYLAVVPVAEGLSWKPEPIATMVGTRLVVSAPVVWLGLVLATFDRAGVVPAESHICPPVSLASLGTAREVDLAAVVLLCEVLTCVDPAKMLGAETSSPIGLIWASWGYTTGYMPLTERRAAESGLDTGGVHALMTRAVPMKLMDGILARLSASRNTTFPVLGAVLDVLRGLFGITAEVSASYDILMFRCTGVKSAELGHLPRSVDGLVTGLVIAVDYSAGPAALRDGRVGASC